MLRTGQIGKELAQQLLGQAGAVVPPTDTKTPLKRVHEPDTGVQEDLTSSVEAMLQEAKRAKMVPCLHAANQA